MSLDPTVFDRLNFDPTSRSPGPDQLPTMSEPYRPVNLLQSLARHPELDGRLGPDALAAVKAYR